MTLDSIELPLPIGSGDGSRFSSLRGVQWRINLGILPCSLSASIEDLRRVAADSRRRYASLRRRLLIDPHSSKDGNRSSDLAKDNPLSQNPDSMWDRFFRNAELEKMVDQDLSRLYPEHGGYFQTPACQTMLRRILLLWCLRNPEYGYRQGMHELLAPLLYVLHVDLHHLSEMKLLYRDYFNDDFDETSSPERDIGGNNSSRFNGTTPKSGNLDELDPITRDIFLLSDAYGAEGELGVVLSERFMEHDAYCMFDSLMSGGAQGAVATADFFSSSSPTGPSNGIPPVIEASAALYHLLSIVDSSLYCHLIELGVEPQYFALRWLRVLFGREFSLDDLLVVWDELFSSPNSKLAVGDSNAESGFGILCSPRGAFISATAVAMLLHMRSSLFATENATSCLQRLLNFPKDINVKKLIEKTKSLQALALEANVSSFSSESCKDKTKPGFHRGRSLSSGSASPQTPLYAVPDSYWEEKWRVMQKEEEATKQGSRGEKKSSGGILKGSLVQRFGLSRTESDPSPVKIAAGEKNSRISVRRRLLDDLAPDVGKRESDEVLGASRSKDLFPSIVSDEGKHFHGAPEDRDINVVHDLPQRNDPPFILDDGEPDDQNTNGRTSDCTAEETSLCLSGDNSSVFSSATSPQSTGHDEENVSEKSSVTSNSFIGENDEEVDHVEEISNTGSESSPLQDTEEVIVPVESQPAADNSVKHEAVAKERRPVSGKFQWFWKIGRGSGDGNADRSSIASDARRDIRREEEGDKKVKGQSVGQSMLENIKVIESVFEQDQGWPAGKDAAMAALEELRKISELLSEM